MYAVRITEPYTALKPFWDRLAETATKLVVYEHPDGRVHNHALVETQVSTDTLKNWVKRALNVTRYPKTNWSFKTAQDDKFITYMSKGKYDPLVCIGVSAEHVALLRSQWVEQPRRELVQYKLKAENPREAKARQNDMMDEVLKRLHELPRYDTRVILETIRQVVVVEHRTIVGRYKMRDYYDYVLLRNGDKRYMDKMEDFVAFRT